jgi:hypothetical protein
MVETLRRFDLSKKWRHGKGILHASYYRAYCTGFLFLATTWKNLAILWQERRIMYQVYVPIVS